MMSYSKVPGCLIAMIVIATTWASMPTAAADENPINPGSGGQWTSESGLSPSGGEWDTTLPTVPSQGSPDPLAVLRGVMNVGNSALGAFGIGTGGNRAISGVPRVYGRAAVEKVIQRGGSQIGVPFSWGGGSVYGPTRGIDNDAGVVGYDCSGFTMFSYAAVGVKLPKYSGDQYNAGMKVPTAQAKRGDLLFWGPGGSQHVTIYLGNGQMLEAPNSGATVRIAPVRTGGMTPYAVRIIQW